MENEPLDLFAHLDTANQPETCLGQTFPNAAARRAHFRALLAEKLKDPAFRAIEGFPKGSDEAILALSDRRTTAPAPIHSRPFLHFPCPI